MKRGIVKYFILFLLLLITFSFIITAKADDNNYDESKKLNSVVEPLSKFQSPASIIETFFSDIFHYVHVYFIVSEMIQRQFSQGYKNIFCFLDIIADFAGKIPCLRIRVSQQHNLIHYAKYLLIDFVFWLNFVLPYNET